jgi:hypothetical protein
MERSLTPEEQALFLRGVEDDLVPPSPESHDRDHYSIEIPGEQIEAWWEGAENYDGDVLAFLRLRITSPTGTVWIADLPVRAEDIRRDEELRWLRRRRV